MNPILLNGHWTPAKNASGSFHAFNPATKQELDERAYPVSSWDDLQAMLDAGLAAAKALATAEPEEIAHFLESYAAEIEARAVNIVDAANAETALPREPRLRNVELPRTVNQLRQAALAARDRGWRRATIDTATNIRSIHAPLGGPVIIFGPNNFPFAYNGVAGGDFAAAIASGNPVIAKAHPAHPYTTTLLAEAALAALKASSLPLATVQVFYQTEPELGLKLVAAPQTGAIAFTGSRPGGLALKAAADKAGKPIYLEMSSVNPVFVFAGALRERGDAIADDLHGSCTLAGGQFCTKPGIIVVERGSESERLAQRLSQKFGETKAAPLLTPHSPTNIAKSIEKLRSAGAELLVGGKPAENSGYAYQPTLLRVSGNRFLEQPEALQTEAFGPACLLVVAEDLEQTRAIAGALEGNLTGSLYTDGAGSDDAAYAAVAPILRSKVGRLLNDKVPTGVAVSAAMNHGGPYPSTGHPGFTAVGFPASLIRFTALQSYDNVRPNRLPPELQNENPTGTMLRLIDGKWTTESVAPRS